MVICLLMAAAALVWPTRVRPPGPARGDRRGVEAPPGAPVVGPIRRPAPRSWPLRLVITPTGAAAVAAALIGAAAAMAGVAGMLAATAVLATGGVLVRRALAERSRRLALTDILASVRMLGRELRAGADPAAAAANAGAGSRGQGADVLIGLAQLAQANGAITGAMNGEQSPRAQTLERLRSGWLLTRRYGLAFTPLVDALASDLAEQLAADAERAGQVAGPRMSGYVMAVLPAMGLALGMGMGADPLRVLLATPVGNGLLLVGVTLTCAGLLWSARIVRR